MPEGNKNMLTARTDAHSDVADTPPARARQTEMAERQLGTLLLRRLRETKADVLQLSNFQEAWHATDEGLVLELSVNVQEAEATA